MSHLSDLLSDNRLGMCQLRCVTFVVSWLNGVQIQKLEHRGLHDAPVRGVLEAKSQAELNRARRVHLRSHNAEGWSADLGVWRAKSYMIERIKELLCALQIHTLCDVIALCDREIPVVHVIHANVGNVPGLVAESDYIGSIYRREAGRVKPTVDRSVFT